LRILSHDEQMPGGILINFSAWSGISAPMGHLKFVLKVTPPPDKGMSGDSFYHRRDIKWTGTRHSMRKALIEFLTKTTGVDRDMVVAINYIKQTFI
jgi:hypothetical protein